MSVKESIHVNFNETNTPSPRASLDDANHNNTVSGDPSTKIADPSMKKEGSFTTTAENKTVAE